MNQIQILVIVLSSPLIIWLGFFLGKHLTDGNNKKAGVFTICYFLFYLAFIIGSVFK